MKTNRVLTGILLLLIVLYIGGCQLTPKQQYATALVSVTTVKESLINFREAGLIDDDEYKRIDPWFKASTEFLAAMKSAYEHGQTDLFKTYYGAIMRALLELQRYNNSMTGEISWPSLPRLSLQ